VKDVAQVRDGYDPSNEYRQAEWRSQRADGPSEKRNASTLSVVSGAKQAMANVLKTVNSAVRVTEFSDQSVFVRAAISGVVREGVIAGALTALMILLFLGSWRSTIVVAISIPLSVLASLAVLSALGETINLMTLGGLALAVGIRSMTPRSPSRTRAPHGPREKTGGTQFSGRRRNRATGLSPLFVSALFLSDVLSFRSRHYLFVPFAEAVVFAVIASYVLSRTLVPTL